MKKESIFLADDHPLLLKGLQDYLTEQGFEVCGTANNGISAYHSIIKLKPAIAILDIEMPGMDGMEIVEKLKGSNTAIIIITIHKDSSIIRQALKLGVKGYLLKEYALKEIDRCITEVLKGNSFYDQTLQELISSISEKPEDTRLSPSEKKILNLVAQQMSSREIASLLCISDKTVEKHRSNIIRKLGLPQSQNSLLTWALMNRDEITGK